MLQRRRAEWCVVLLAVASLLPVSSADAQDSSALMARALDEKVTLEADKPLPEVLRIITSATGVRLREDPVIWELLPWGRETTVQLKARNVTLREAVERLAARVGLVMRLRDEYVELLPCPALRRLGQRASRDEIAALDLLASQPAALETTGPTLRQLLEAVDLKLAAVKEPALAIENRLGQAVRLDQSVFVARNATLMDALEAIPNQTRGTWYPWGRTIVIVTKDDRTRQLLARPLSMRGGAGGLDVLQMVLEIAARTGVPIELGPGTLQGLPAESRVIRGADGRPPVLENVPAQQILDIISAVTGIAFTIDDDRVVGALAAGTAAARDRAIGLIPLEGGMQVVLPASQVPPDLQEYLQWRTEQELARLRRRMAEEGFRPSTAPVTQPARP